jgi:hypothetical protein
MTQHIRYAMCHGKVVMSFKARPPEFAGLWLDPAVPPRSACLSSSEGSRRVQQPQVVDASSSPSKFEAFEGALGLSLVVFPMPPAWHCLWSCFSWSMFQGARRLPPVYLWGAVVAIHLCRDHCCRCRDALSSCRLPRSPEGRRGMPAG